MVKVIEDSRSEEGFPSVYWEQEVPTGQSAYSLQQSMDLKIAAVVMVFVFAAVYAWSGEFWGAVLAAFIIGGMCLAGDKMFKGGVKVWDIHIPGPEPRDTTEADRRAKATPILGKECRGILVQPEDDTHELYVWLWKGPDTQKRQLLGHAPLASLQSFELGTADEWFEGIAQAELRRTVSAPNSWVIVAPTLGHGVLWIAESAGSKAGIAALHGLLTKRFVVDAPEMLARWKEQLEAAAREAEAHRERHAEAGEGSDAAGAPAREK